MKNNKSDLSWLPGAGLAMLALVGCGGGGLTADADPSGYYDVSGTATVKAEDNTTDLAISNLQAMVDGNSGRIMMMGTGIIDEIDQLEAQFLYDGMITITQNSFEADFRIYTTTSISSVGTGGQNPIDATASGTFTEGSSIIGTLVSSEGGVGNGTFSLTYATSDNQAAAISRIENGPGNGEWIALIGGGSIEQRFVINNAGVITHFGSPGGGIFGSCEMNGMITPINETSLYSVTVELATCNAGGGLTDGSYTGLAASRADPDTDDTLVFAVTGTSETNDAYSPNGEFK